MAISSSAEQKLPLSADSRKLQQHRGNVNLQRAWKESP